MSFKAELIRNLKNLPGKKTNRKIVCIYIDDYGSIRVKNKQAYDALLRAGIPMDSNRYSRFDTLASSEDMQMLFDVLTSVKDSQGNFACVTPFVNIANPDFERIRESGYTQYFREPFTKTLQRYGSCHEKSYDLWKQGIAENLFHPEYHGTEHINVLRFMQALQLGHKSTMLGFKNESVALPLLNGENSVAHPSAVFYIEKAEENNQLKNDICDGISMFKDILGYTPNQFTPGAGIYSPALHPTLMNVGIKYINAQRYMAYPLGDGKYEKRFLYNGKRNSEGQYYVVRNCVFEPYLDDCSHNNTAVTNCLKNVEAAFRMHSPAIISTHRVNFVGSIETSHRNDSLMQLKILLKEIIKRWPEVEFMDGTRMCEIVF